MLSLLLHAFLGYYLHHVTIIYIDKQRINPLLVRFQKQKIVQKSTLYYRSCIALQTYHSSHQLAVVCIQQIKQPMKLKSKWVLCMLFLCTVFTKSDAQVQFSRKYRVIAYKTGSPQVFSVSNEVEIIPAMSLYIPNTFTPNGDGMNDTFGVAGEAIKDFRMQIYNRWGQLVFESSDANQRWDGRYKGDQVPEGAYVYKVTAQGATGKKETREGHLNVVL